jgi:membrane fusion protein
MELFRPEVAASQRSRLHGEVTLTGANSGWPITAIISAIVVGGIAWTVLGTYARTETAFGRIVPDGSMTKIIPVRPGILSTLQVREGQTVRSGQVLATIVLDQPTTDRSAPAKEGLASIDLQQKIYGDQIFAERARSSNEQQKIINNNHHLREQISSLDGQIESQKLLVASARESFEPLTDAMKQGYVSKSLYEQRRQQYLNAQIQLAQMQTQHSQYQSQLEENTLQSSEQNLASRQKIDEFQSSKSSLFQKGSSLKDLSHMLLKPP